MQEPRELGWEVATEASPFPSPTKKSNTSVGLSLKVKEMGAEMHSLEENSFNEESEGVRLTTRKPREVQDVTLESIYHS